MMTALSYRAAQLAALRAMQVELASIGIDIPLLLTPNGRSALAAERAILIGDGFSPAEIPPVVRHEAGHKIREAIHMARQRLGTQGIFVNEQEADAIAGWLTVRAGESVALLLATLESVPTDPTHGTFNERAAAVMVGAIACLAARGAALAAQPRR